MNSDFSDFIRFFPIFRLFPTFRLLDSTALEWTETMSKLRTIGQKYDVTHSEKYLFTQFD